MGYFQVRYTSSVVIYECKMFIRMATEIVSKEVNNLFTQMSHPRPLFVYIWSFQQQFCNKQIMECV